MNIRAYKNRQSKAQDVKAFTAVQKNASFSSGNQGIALVTALMLTLISLTIVTSLLLLITQGTQFSGMNKRYRTTVQASYGGLELLTKDILLKAFNNHSSATMLPGMYPSTLNMVVSDCFGSKVTNPTSAWPAGCDTNPSPKQNPDITFMLQSATASPFTIYAKVVDTSSSGSASGGGAGNTETALVPTLRDAHNVVDPGSGSGTTIPRYYRIEIQGERSTNPSEKSQLSVLYAY